nr:MAG TPA: hypothetical protein [Caudoviricetes sp.]
MEFLVEFAPHPVEVITHRLDSLHIYSIKSYADTYALQG